jgi:hypothetical protein
MTTATARAGLLVRRIQAHIDILPSCDWWILLRPILVPSPRKGINDTIDIRSTELGCISFLLIEAGLEALPKGLNTSLLCIPRPLLSSVVPSLCAGSTSIHRLTIASGNLLY